MRGTRPLPRTLASLLLALAVAACGRDGAPGPAPTSPGVTGAGSGPAAVTVAGGEAMRIADDPVEEEMPAVSGDRVVWVAGDPSAGPRAVFLHDLSESTTRQIVPDDGDPIRPDIDGDIVAWEDGRDFPAGEPDDIFALDLSTGQETQITATIQRDNSAAVGGDRVVWVERPGFLTEGFSRRNPGPGDVFLHDLSTGTTSAVAAKPDISERGGDIAGDRVVWVENPTRKILLKDLSRGSVRELPTATGAFRFPALSTSIVAWPERRGDDLDIFAFNLSTGTKIQVTDDAATQQQVAVSGDRIVWEDRRSGDWDIFVHDLSTGETRRLTDHPADQVEPDVDGERVVWKDLRSGDGDIFLLELRITIDQIADRVDQLRASGAIDNRGVATSLRKMLQQAEAAREQGNLRAARNQLRAFIRLVEAQAGKHITREAADEMVTLTRRAIEDL